MATRERKSVSNTRINPVRLYFNKLLGVIRVKVEIPSLKKVEIMGGHALMKTDKVSLMAKAAKSELSMNYTESPFNEKKADNLSPLKLINPFTWLSLGLQTARESLFYGIDRIDGFDGNHKSSTIAKMAKVLVASVIVPLELAAGVFSTIPYLAYAQYRQFKEYSRLQDQQGREEVSVDRGLVDEAASLVENFSVYAETTRMFRKGMNVEGDILRVERPSKEALDDRLLLGEFREPNSAFRGFWSSTIGNLVAVKDPNNKTDIKEQFERMAIDQVKHFSQTSSLAWSLESPPAQWVKVKSQCQKLGIKFDDGKIFDELDKMVTKMATSPDLFQIAGVREVVTLNDKKDLEPGDRFTQKREDKDQEAFYRDVLTNHADFVGQMRDQGLWGDDIQTFLDEALRQSDKNTLESELVRIVGRRRDDTIELLSGQNAIGFDQNKQDVFKAAYGRKQIRDQARAERKEKRQVFFNKWIGPVKETLSGLKETIQAPLRKVFAPAKQQVSNLSAKVAGFFGKAFGAVQGAVSGLIDRFTPQDREGKNWKESSLHDGSQMEQDNPLYEGSRAQEDGSLEEGVQNVGEMNWKDNPTFEGVRDPESRVGGDNPLFQGEQASKSTASSAADRLRNLSKETRSSIREADSVINNAGKDNQKEEPNSQPLPSKPGPSR